MVSTYLNALRQKQMVKMQNNEQESEDMYMIKYIER